MSETPSSSYSANHPNSSESEQSLSTRHFNVTEPVVAKRICFYKSGDPQFNGIKMVVNSRSYKTFDALLDSLSKRVPLPFGVRNISTPRGRHSITNLEDLEDGKSYICSHQRKMKPINLEQASKKPLPWQISRPVSARRRAVQLARQNEDGFGHRESRITTPKKMLVFKNGDVRLRRTIVLGKKNTQTFEAFLDYISELMQYPVAKLYTTDGRKVPNLQALILCSGAVVAAGREPFKPSNYESLGYLRPAKFLGIGNRVYPKVNAKSESEKMRTEMDSSSRSQIFSVCSDKGSSNDNNSESSYVLDSHNGIGGNRSVIGEDLSVSRYQDDIEKSVHINQDGSITVEMKVRFKIKEEETIKWTTTVSRAGLSDDKNISICNSSAMKVEDCSSNVNMSDCKNPKDAPFLKSCNKEGEDLLQQSNEEVSEKESEPDLKTADCNVSKNNSADLDVSNVPEENIKPHFYRPPTPGPRRVRQKKAVVESVTLVSEKEVQEKTIGQFSYSEEIENGEKTSEYCMVAHSSRKKSSVSNPKFNEVNDNALLKMSSENIKEEMLFKVSHKSSELIETTNRKILEVPNENELVQNILEKSAVGQGAYSSLVSTSKANISGFTPLSKTYQTARPGTADHIHKSCDIKQIKRSVSSFITYSELCQSKEEIKCQAADLVGVSQDSVHPACAGHSQKKVMAPPCSKSPTEKVNQTTGFFPTVTESETQINARTESVMTMPIENNQPASSLTKNKKKKRKSSSFLEEGTYESQKHQEISGMIRSEGLHITQDSTTEAMDKYSEMPQKKGSDYFVRNNDGSANSDKTIHPEGEFNHQDLVEQNGSPSSSSNKKKRSNNKKLAKVKLKSGKKSSIISTAKSEDGLITADSNNESKHSQDMLNTEKEGTHLMTSSFKQTLNSSKLLSEVPKNLNFEKEKNNLEHLLSKKEKKQKMKKNLGKGVSKKNMLESAITLEALNQECFQENVVEHSRENYVQTWLKNSFSNSVLPPIKKREGTAENSNACSSPKENTDASIEKEARFNTNNMHVTGKTLGDNLTRKPLTPIGKVGIPEDSDKDSDERQTDSLIHSNASVLEEAKYLLKAEFHQDSKLHLFHEAHDNDKKMAEVDIQVTNLCQIKRSEVAVQADCTIVSEKIGIEVQNNCMSNMLLHELQSALLGLQKGHSGCVGKSCGFSDLSPAAFGSSSNALLAWLLLLNLRESLIGTITDNAQKNPCSCSEIFTQLKCLKQTAAVDQADELKTVFSHLQQSTENNLLHFRKEPEKQGSTHENMPTSEIPNDTHLHEHEESVEPSIAMGSVNSEEALKLTGESESCFDIERDFCKETETLDMTAPKTQVDGQYNNMISNTCSLPSAVETPERNEEMPVNTRNIGHLYKIRIGHTNAGNSPAWHCKEVQLLNLFSGEQFSFPANRWLAKDQSDGEISVELPVLQQGQPILPVTVYKVHVTTGDLWNAGTEADIYISVYGERGDTGSRQLLRSQKPKKFLKGQTDIFAVEAVHLGCLYKIVIGHNGLGSGNGWFLDKVVIKDPITDLDYTFLCHRWLDQGQDDGNISRELPVTDASMLPGRQELELKRGKAWAAEKWKFRKGVILQFYNRVTRGFICLYPDSRVDALGDKKNKHGLFHVNVKRRNICIFSSHQMPSLALALVSGRVTGKAKDKACCELRVHLQPNSCAILESASYPGHTVAFNLQGKVADEATGYAGLSKEFVVHVKGVFHHGAIILLNTSLCQALSLRSDGSCSGAGQQQQESYWKVHKIGSGLCMFESVHKPRMYLKIKDDQCDGTGKGDEYCHFKIEKNLETGSVSLESVQNKGIYVGLLPDGQTKPVVNTGERNIFFYPQVIKFGREKPMGTSAAPKQEKKDFRESQIQSAEAQESVPQRLSTSSPSKEMRNPHGGERPLPLDDEWRVSILTGNAGTEASVALWIYGDRGLTGPITLGKDSRKQLFFPMQEDEFQVKINSIGNIYKIRIELDGLPNEQPEWNLQRSVVSSVSQVSVFEVEAVSLGKLQKVLLCCEATTKSQHWYCDKVIVREAESNSEYVFNCERWLPFMSQGVTHSEIELYPQEGDWKITVVTGDFETAGTTATVFFYAYGENKASGPIILGSGKQQLFNPNSEDTFKVQYGCSINTRELKICTAHLACVPSIRMSKDNSINLRDLGQLYKIRIGHDNSGNDPSWYLKQVRLERVVPVSAEEICLPIESWLSEDKDEGDTWREVAIRNPAEELLP
ncbi:Oxygen-regulated protein 1 [Lonchura striata]|uniref:Oxygen-regulated protein 1 n=1 Tax=Lonchura striata TaxID=40157 RepID=A0A218VCC7_9PASE|nr:Oxygen-regulated protein 1 [Lonchura striata domestica]